MLDTACRQLQEWSQEGALRHLTIAVNVSAQQFKQPDFVEIVQAVTRRYQVPPGQLKLELTESVILADVSAVIERMKQLKTLGVKLSLDDFGTGYSSLSYLKRLPIDQIKIDKSFVRDIETDSNDALMVRAIIDMARNFNLEVIAEGVENQAQLDFLLKNRCFAFQGYLFAKPMPIEALSPHLALAFEVK